MSGGMLEPAFAYVSNQKVHLRRDGVTMALRSEFEHSVRERAASIERRHAWKQQGHGAVFTGAAAAAHAGARPEVHVLLTGLSRAVEDGVLYTLETDAISGVFQLGLDGVETRLFHTADFRVRHPSLHPEGSVLAASVFHPDSVRSNIAILPVHESGMTEMTEGDSFDQSPRWVPGPRREIVFQSGGVGRDAAGNFAGMGPCTIQKLDVDSGELLEIAAENGFDLLQPSVGADGTLYYVRKPYEPGLPETGILTSLKDAVLFPFRLGRAIFQYFNIFSMMYTGKPLVTGQGAAQRRIDPRQLLISANLAQALAHHERQEEARSLVPESWELVRREPGGRTEIVAKSVLTYDVRGDGSVVHSDGAAVTLTAADGCSRRLLQGGLIERVLAL